MCTAVTLQSLQMECLFGRTMDFSHVIDPALYVMPKGYVWGNPAIGAKYANQYSFLAIGQKEGEMLAFADGVNERGFAVAALYFEGYAQYGTPVKNSKKDQVAAVDLVHYLLGRCGTVAEIKRLLQGIAIAGVIDPVTESVAPLHWMAVDKNGECAVIEATRQGVQVHPNNLGVMANGPDFLWHMTNLRNYMGVTQVQMPQAVWGETQLLPFGQGGGSSLLPGGFTSPERFVRAAFLKTHATTPKSRTEAALSGFHILGGVSIPKGAVITSRNTYDYTKYTAMINTNAREYFVKTYDNPQIACASLERHRSCTQPLCLGKLSRPVSFERV